MALSRRELLGYAVAGATGTGITAAQERSEPGVGQRWQLGGVYARPARIGDTAVTFRASAESKYDTDYEVEVALFYRPKAAGGANATTGGKWRNAGSKTGALSESVYLEATVSDLEPGRTYEYRAEAYLTNYDGHSRRVSETFAVTAGRPCSGPSTNCLRVATRSPEVSDDGSEVTLRATAKGLAAYDEVAGHFFYRREGSDEKHWTDYVAVSGESNGGDSGKFSATLSELPAGSYTYYAEARGEGGGMKNMYGEGRERAFRVE
ncbi:hypothetical protein [Halorussus caseinilyticus]|uniref:Fibronectin type III domain-containing protein n=1 Tax=Halorussus caseinilyticus TaxID=3034025 RepID=A0ABD5WUC2_9EURY|nr:hypothetical protein [Halorussus sp. DT72]